MPHVLDLFCGAGGASMGYSQAGFDVIGIDIRKQKHYPFPFFTYDAMEWQDAPVHLPKIDLIHASPPCQRYSKLTKNPENHPDYISALREMLVATGIPYIIENVEGAPLRDPVLLCGSMFNLGLPDRNLYLRRHRLFESNLPLTGQDQAKGCIHFGLATQVNGRTGGKSTRDGTTFLSADQWREVMGTPWMSAEEMKEAIPPAYTKFLGEQVMELIQ